jgi:ubiquinone/menaquinone biosynthesis C-methylase UbiE
MEGGMPADTGIDAELDDPNRSQETQARVSRHFSAHAHYWEQLYVEPTVYGAIHRERHRRALEWIDELGLAEGSRVVEVGCGAGLLAADLVRRAFVTDCIDSSDAMVALTRDRLAKLGGARRATVSEGDVHSLRFGDGSRDLVVALGVLPFLHSPVEALREIARILKPGGWVVLSSDNQYRLTHCLDPRLTPLLPGRERLKRLLRRLSRGRDRMTPYAFSFGVLADMLHGAGFEIRRDASLGFGPFTMFAAPLLPESVGLAVHRRLQAMADRGVPILSATGAQHLVLATLTVPAYRRARSLPEPQSTATA